MVNSNNKVLISGSTGFVGQNLISYFKREHIIVRTIGRTHADYSWEDVAIIPNGLDAYIHLAGKAHDVKNTSHAEEYFKVNTDLTIKLFNHFLDSDAKTFIYISSVKAAADVVDEVLTEESKASPQTPYGQSKRKAEEYMLSMKLPQYKRVIILRPCMIHGPGNKGNLNLLYQFVAKGIPYPFGAFDNERSFLTVENLSFTIKQFVLRSDLENGIYNVSDDTYLSSKRLIELISEELGRKPKIWSFNAAIIRLVGRFGDLLKLPINSHRIDKLTEDYRVSNAKLKKALGIKEMPISAEDGMRQTLVSFKS